MVRPGMWVRYCMSVCCTVNEHLLGYLCSLCKRFYRHSYEFFTTAQNSGGFAGASFLWVQNERSGEYAANHRIKTTLTVRLKKYVDIWQVKKTKIYSNPWFIFVCVISFASTSAFLSHFKEREEAGMRKVSLGSQSRSVSWLCPWFCQERRRFKENLQVRSSEHSKADSFALAATSCSWHGSMSHLWSNHSRRSYSCDSYSRVNQCCKCSSWRYFGNILWLKTFKNLFTDFCSSFSFFYSAGVH